MSQEPKFTEELEACAHEAVLYALGASPPDQASAVELRIRSGCPYCLAQVESCAFVAEQISLSVKSVEPPPAIRAKLLSRIALEEAIPANTEHRTVVRNGEASWTKMEIPGVEFRPLIAGRTFMVRLQPGAVFPKHDHPKAEQCYVLSGSITDSDGLTLQAGDFVVMSSGIQHDPIRSATGCTLFIAYAD